MTTPQSSSSSSPTTPTPTPPGQILALITSLSNPINHAQHAAALSARDAYLSTSLTSYSQTCTSLAHAFACPTPDCIPPNEMDIWRNADGPSVMQIQHDPVGSWIRFRELAGMMLKLGLEQFILNPECVNRATSTNNTTTTAEDIHTETERYMKLLPNHQSEIQSILLNCMVDGNPTIRKVASSIIASGTVGASSFDSSTTKHGGSGSEYTVSTKKQKRRRREALPLHQWGESILGPSLHQCLVQGSALIQSSEQQQQQAQAAASTATATNSSSPVPHPLQQVVQDTSKPTPCTAVLGALQTLSKVLEDDAIRFEMGCGASFTIIVPSLLQLLTSSMVPNEGTTTTNGSTTTAAASSSSSLPKTVSTFYQQIQTDVLKCLISLIKSLPTSLIANMDHFLTLLGQLGQSHKSEIRTLVCRAIVTLLQHQSQYLQSHISDIAQFILHSTQDTSHPDVALEACEFWLSFGSLDEDACTPDMAQVVRDMLPQILPTLIKSMVHPPGQIEELMEENRLDEMNATEAAKDVAPIFHRSKAKGGGGGGGPQDSKNDDDSDLDDDDDDDDDEEKEWTLRTCAAASLDMFSVVYPNDAVLPHLLSSLQESLSHSNPWIKEAGILALGAISNGCEEAMNAHMGQLHPYLMSQVTTVDALPQLKGITCWTLARYANWAVDQTASGIQPELVGRMTEAILKLVLDRNRKVQVAACSALSEICEAASGLLVPFLQPIYMTLVQALGIYQTRSFIVLLDTFGSLAEYIGVASGEGDLPQIYVPALIAKWRAMESKDLFERTLLPLMESLASIVLNIGMEYQPWALETFECAMNTINNCMMTVTDDFDDEEADPIIGATDLLDALAEGLGYNFQALVSSSQKYGQHFLSVLNHLAGHEVSGIRMSAFALMGDVAKNCPVVIQEGLGELLEEAIANIDSFQPSICNNAVWAIGEVCVKCNGNPDALQRYAPEIVENLVTLLMVPAYVEDGNGYSTKGLSENAASTMGRLAKVNPAFVANDLHRFLRGWCDGMSKINDLNERSDAFEGFLMSVSANPSSIQAASPQDIPNTVMSILFAIVCWHLPGGTASPELLSGASYNFVPFPTSHQHMVEGISSFLHSLKNLVGAETWNQVEREMPVNVRRLMREQYHL